MLHAKFGFKGLGYVLVRPDAYIGHIGRWEHWISWSPLWKDRDSVRLPSCGYPFRFGFWSLRPSILSVTSTIFA